MKPCALILATLLLAALRPSPLHADGLPVSPAGLAAVQRPAVLSDGRGGAVIAFKDSTGRFGATWVNLEGVPDGRPGIALTVPPFALENGEPLRAIDADESSLSLLADHAAASTPAFAPLFAAEGTRAMPPLSLPFALPYPEAVVIPERRTLLMSKYSDGTNFWMLRAAAIGPDGTLQWAAEFPSVRQFFNVDRMACVRDSSDGLIAIIPYFDFNMTGTKDLGVFRIRPDGTPAWGTQLTPFILGSRDQYEVVAVHDERGGALFAWTDLRNSTRSGDIFAMRVTKDMQHGEPTERWGYYGNTVCTASGHQSEPAMLRDGTGGAWVVWRDARSDAAGDLRFSHLLGNGLLATGFTTDGRVLCAEPGAQRDVVLAGDGEGGFFAAWRDERTGTSDIRAMHVRTNGDFAAGWPAGGLAVCDAPGAQDQPAIHAVTPGRAVVAWRDARSGTTRIHAAGIGTPGVTDVPDAGSALTLHARGTSRGAIECELTLAAALPTRLELLDIAGRRLADAEPAAVEGRTRITLSPAAPLAPGLYLVRLRQGEAQRVARVTVLR